MRKTHTRAIRGGGGVNFVNEILNVRQEWGSTWWRLIVPRYGLELTK